METSKLYAILPIHKRLARKTPASPRFDLAPMNHQAACNWMDACRDAWTDYTLIDWPSDVPHPEAPIYASAYRRDKQPV